jgi:hypothetical protein
MKILMNFNNKQAIRPTNLIGTKTISAPSVSTATLGGRGVNLSSPMIGRVYAPKAGGGCGCGK